MSQAVNENIPVWLKYFCFMGKDEVELVKKWVPSAWKDANSPRQCIFMARVEDALRTVNYDYYISTIEPSLDEHGFIVFEPGNEVFTDFDLLEWVVYSEAFYRGPLCSEKVLSPSGEAYIGWNSKLANIHELYIWYAWRIAKGYWTLKEVCDDSSAFGNYSNSPNAACGIEVSGAREVAGFKDGVGNTNKLVTAPGRNAYWVFGGCNSDNGTLSPVSHARFFPNWQNANRHSRTTGVIVLKPGLVRC